MNRRLDPQFFIERHTWYWPHAVFTIVVIAALIALTVWLVTNARKQPSVQHMLPMGPPAPPLVDPALAEARMRYARGEISREDFLRISADLGGSPPAMPPASQ